MIPSFSALKPYSFSLERPAASASTNESGEASVPRPGTPTGLNLRFSEKKRWLLACRGAQTQGKGAQSSSARCARRARAVWAVRGRAGRGCATGA